MWYDDEIIAGKKLGSVKRERRGTTTLNLRKSKRKTSKSNRFHQIAVIVLVPIVAAVLVTLAWLGFDQLGKWLFSENPRFAIRRLTIKDEGTAVSDFVRGEKNINEGRNIFSFNIEELRREFVERAPSYKSIAITRTLPGMLTVEALPRVPLARVFTGWRSSVVTDKHGMVFSPVGYSQHLPAIKGYKDKGLRPGMQIGGMAVAALQLIDVCQNPRLGLSIDEVDVGEDEHLAVLARYGGRRRRILLSWNGMGTRAPESRLRLLKKLGYWVQAMQKGQGREHVRFDGTYPDRIYAK
mgnify:CR=1 FL=1